MPSASDHAIQILVSSVSAIGAMVAALIARTAVAKITEVHLSLNSRLDLLIEATRSLAHAQGVAEGAALEAAARDALAVARAEAAKPPPETPPKEG